MRTGIVARTALQLVFCSFLFACGEASTEPGADTSDAEQVDNLLAELSAGQAAGAAASVTGGGSGQSAPAESADACQYEAAGQRFVCPTRNFEGLTLASYFQLLDASNAPQSAFNEATTAAIRMVSDLSGTIQVPMEGPSGEVQSTQTQNQHTDIILSGLLTGTHVMNGTGTATMVLVMPGFPTTNATLTSTFSNLVMPHVTEPTDNVYPLSGSISTDITSVVEGFPPFLSHQVMTFNGTPIATMVITSEGTTQTCTYDMSKPDTPPSCSGA